MKKTSKSRYTIGWSKPASQRDFERATREGDTAFHKAANLIHQINLLKGHPDDVTGQRYLHFLTLWQQGKNDAAIQWKLVRELNQCLSELKLECQGTPGGPIGLYPVLLPNQNESAWLAWQFCEFVSSPWAEKVLLCPRCGKYFINTANYPNKKFCSQRCASLETSARAMKIKWESEHKKKLQEVLSWYKRINEKPENQGWKDWIAKKAKVTTWWLTRAINKGELPADPAATARTSQPKERRSVRKGK